MDWAGNVEADAGADASRSEKLIFRKTGGCESELELDGEMGRVEDADAKPESGGVLGATTEATGLGATGDAADLGAAEGDGANSTG